MGSSYSLTLIFWINLNSNTINMRKDSNILFPLILLLFLGCQNNEKKGLFNLEDKIILDEIKRIKSLENASERLQKIDSLYHFFNQKTTIDSLQLYILYEKSNLHFGVRQIDSSYHYDHLLLKQSDAIGVDFFSGKARQGIAYFHKRRNEYDSAYYYYNASKNFFQKLRDSTSTGRCLMNMGLIQKNQNDFFGSKQTLVEALKYLNPNKDGKHIASCYNILGTNHRKLGNLEDAIHYYSKATNLTNSAKEKLRYNNNLAAALIDFKKYQKAENLLNNILADSVIKKKSSQYARVLDNIAYVQWLSDKKLDKVAFLNPLQLRKESNDKRGQIASYTHLGEFYSKKNPIKAKQYLDTVIQLSKNLKIPRAEKDALRLAMELEPKNVAKRNRYIALQDSLYAQEQKVKTQFAKMKYDDEQKQARLLKLEKENTEKELEVSRQENQKLLSYTIGGLVFILSCFGIFLLVQRTKRLKKEKETAALEATYKTEEELSRKLHDDFGSKLNTAMGMLQSNDDPSKVLDVLDDAYEQSRDFSRVINDVDTEANYKDELLAMLGSRKTPEVQLFTTGLDKLEWSIMPALTKTTLFKVLQELMINMGKHSEATAVVLTFKLFGKTLAVEYIDDGKGASKAALSKKNGLRNTEKRIQAIGGSITFDSEEGNGFKATIRIPQ